ncbi:MAG: ComF family protein [Saprospiraceae bacterium]|nr:ComF family protein [Saprospiraceae bacterium]
MNTFISIVKESFIDLIFPTICIHCENRCENSNEVFCYRCQILQKPTDHHLHKKNEFTHHFYGRVNIHTGASLYYYNPGGIIHSVLEQIKYRGQQQWALRLGNYYADFLKQSVHFQNIDIITAVPLHPSKQALRGYNQSAVFATGLSDKMEVPCNFGILRKIRKDSSQTDKSRIERINNIFNSFEFNSKINIKGKHILLADDVLTTGATLEACIIELMKGSPSSISLVCIAMGKN